jgi:hypothetical protein
MCVNRKEPAPRGTSSTSAPMVSTVGAADDKGSALSCTILRRNASQRFRTPVQGTLPRVRSAAGFVMSFFCAARMLLFPTAANQHGAPITHSTANPTPSGHNEGCIQQQPRRRATYPVSRPTDSPNHPPLPHSPAYLKSPSRVAVYTVPFALAYSTPSRTTDMTKERKAATPSGAPPPVRRRWRRRGYGYTRPRSPRKTSRRTPGGRGGGNGASGHRRRHKGTGAMTATHTCEYSWREPFTYCCRIPGPTGSHAYDGRRPEPAGQAHAFLWTRSCKTPHLQ